MAISIPIFNSQLEKSRDAVTLSNIRAAYAQAQSAYLTGSGEGTGDTATVVVHFNATDKKKIDSVDVKGVIVKGQQEGLDNIDQLPFADKIAADSKTALGKEAGTYTLTFKYNSDGISEVTATK